MPLSTKITQWKRRVKRKRSCLESAQQAGAPATQVRNMRRALHRAQSRRNTLLRKHTRYILMQRIFKVRAQAQSLRQLQVSPRIATWNTRGLGAPYAPNTQMKIQCFIHRMILQKWGCMALTDLKGPDGVREYTFSGRTWILITHKKVGFLLNDVWTQWWREGQAKLFPQGDRVLGIQFPRRGWRRGLFLVSVYAPTSDSTPGERQGLRDNTTNVLLSKESTSITIVLGDINAELGNNRDPYQPGKQAMGPFGGTKTTAAGLEWRTWAEFHGYRDCTSRFQLRHRSTWTHPRFHSTHELDHIFIHESCLWHLKSARVLAEGPNVEWPWGDYTDHNPVEICLIGRDACGFPEVKQFNTQITRYSQAKGEHG